MRKRSIEYGLLALLLWSPLPAASVEEWSVFVIELAVALMAAAYVLLDVKPSLNRHLPPVLRPLRFFAAGFFSFVALQVLPLPAGVVRAISPGSYEFQRLYSPGFAGKGFMSLSIAPSATLREGLLLAACFLLGFLVLRTVSRGREIRRIIVVLVGAGVFQALYGLFELTREKPRILFYEKLFSPDSVTGTFVNRNHLSGYLEMIIPLALGLAIARMHLLTFGVKGFRERVRLWTSKGVLANVLLLAAAVIMSLGVLFSDSRSGLAVLLFMAFLFLGLSALTFSRAGHLQAWAGKFIRAALVVVTVLAVAIGVGTTIQRFALDDLLHEDRPSYWSNTAGIVGDFPLFGTGLGTFGSAYNAHEKRSAGELEIRHAHNDYLEYAAEAGILGTLLLLGGILYVAVRAFLSWRVRRNTEARGLAMGGIVSLAGIGLHAVTDFNLHIPANMVLFAVVLSLTLVMAYYRKS
jgi:O-antigen ligase